jgi:hypothetical protein
VDQTPFHDLWAKEPLLVAVADIANSTKHFTLRDPRTRLPPIPKTKRVRLKKARFSDLYVSSDGRTLVVPALAPDAVITLSDNNKHDLYGFMAGVLDYWRHFLGSQGIRVRRQASAKLRGSAT